MENNIFEQIQSIEKESFEDAWSLKMIEGTLEEDYNFLITIPVSLAKDENIKGYLIGNLIAGESEILRIAIKKDERSKGLGDALIKEYFEFITKKEITRSILEVRDENLVAKKLYIKNGYNLIATRKNYYHNPTDDAQMFEVKIRETEIC